VTGVLSRSVRGRYCKFKRYCPVLVARERLRLVDKLVTALLHDQNRTISNQQQSISNQQINLPFGLILQAIYIMEERKNPNTVIFRLRIQESYLKCSSRKMVGFRHESLFVQLIRKSRISFVILGCSIKL